MEPNLKQEEKDEVVSVNCMIFIRAVFFSYLHKCRLFFIRSRHDTDHQPQYQRKPARETSSRADGYELSNNAYDEEEMAEIEAVYRTGGSLNSKVEFVNFD